jgi:hypothetical protein
MQPSHQELIDKYSRDYECLRTTASSIVSGATIGIDSGASDVGANSAEIQRRLVEMVTVGPKPFDIVTAKIQPAEESPAVPPCPLSKAYVVTRFKKTTGIIRQTITGDSIREPLLGEPNLADQGHFVQQFPSAKPDNVARMRSRFCSAPTDRDRFFTQSGEVKTDTPQLSATPPPFRKKTIFLNNSEQKTVFVPGAIWGIENSSSARHIRLEIYSIRFSSHPLSSQHDILANRLIQLVNGYIRTVEFSRSEYFLDKITTLRSDLKRTPADAHLRLYREIVSFHQMREDEDARVVELRDAIQATWHAIRDLRPKGTVTFPIGLRWKIRRFTDSEKAVEERQFNEAFELRATEELILAKLENKNTIPLADLRAQLLRRHQELGLREPGGAQWIPELVSVESAEFEDLPPEEQARLTSLSKARVYVSFMMGTTDMRSEDCSFGMDFSVTPNVGCRAMTMHVPRGVRVHIHEYGYGKDGECASVVVPVHQGDAPEFTEYEFAGAAPLPDLRVVEGVLKAR